MPRPLIIFRIGWMKSYIGVDEIHGGGSYVDENGEGGEMWNFRGEAGRCYGYVMTRNFTGINLSRIFPDQKWTEGSENSGVDIVFIAKSPLPNLGQAVVGWYQDATVFHKEYRKRRGNKRQRDWTKIEYLCEAKSKNATLVPEPERSFKIPRGEGFPGHSNVWYGDNDKKNVIQFKEKLRRYIKSGASNPAEKGTKGKGKMGRKLNKEEILAIEKSAIEKTWAFYKGKNYKVLSVEADNVGWDLEAVKGDDILFLEVKGHKGNVVQFELTPNEYTQLQARKKTYRVCVVRNALTKPDLKVFTPKKKKGCWSLVDVNNNEWIRLDERVGAKAVQIDL